MIAWCGLPFPHHSHHKPCLIFIYSLIHSFLRSVFMEHLLSAWPCAGNWQWRNKWHRLGPDLLECITSQSEVVLLGQVNFENNCAFQKKSIYLGDIFHWGEVDQGLCGLPWCAVTDMLSGEGGLNKLDSSEGFGLARKMQSIPKLKGECLHICLLLHWPLTAKQKKGGLFFSNHRWAKRFWL